MSKPIFSYEAFRDFAASKDPSERFMYIDSQRCACAQYCATLGLDYRRDPAVHSACQKSGIEYAAAAAARDDQMYGTWGELVQELDRRIAMPLQPLPTFAERIYHALWT